jgi:hypothetical protein
MTKSIFLTPSLKKVVESIYNKVISIYHDEVDFSDSVSEESCWIIFAAATNVQVDSAGTVRLVVCVNNLLNRKKIFNFV